MTDRISLDKFCDILSKMNMEFTDFVLEDWESIEEGNTKLDGMTKKEWLELYLKFIKGDFK
tara:strand:+ start:322 stop:504 length:183 start_codon:yes stop_codon:yes gene_type:complete